MRKTSTIVTTTMILACAASISMVGTPGASAATEATATNAAGLPINFDDLESRGAIDAEDFPAAQIESYAAYRSVDSTVAQQLLVWEQRANAVISQARREHPDSFAGAVINQDVLGQATLAFTDGAEARGERLRAASQLSTSLATVTATYSLAALDAILAEITQDFDRYAQEGLLSASVDEAANGLRLGVASEAALSATELRHRYGNAIAITEVVTPGFDEDVPPSALGCRSSSRNDCNPLRGGTRIHRQNNVQAFCSIGFNARARSNGARVVLSAGHCADDLRSHSNSNVGRLRNQVECCNVDAQAVLVEAAGWQSSRWVYIVAGNEASQIRTSWGGGAGSLARGSALCVSGAASGWVCGAVRNSNQTATINTGTFSQMLAYDMCTAGGDSGGAVINGTTAIAIHKGGYPGTGAGCFRWSSFVSYTEDALGVDITVN